MNVCVNECEVNHTPRTVYLNAAVSEMRDEGRAVDGAERAWPRLWVIQTCREAKYAALSPVSVPVHSGRCSEMRLSDWHLRPDETCDLGSTLQTWNITRNVIKACLLLARFISATMAVEALQSLFSKYYENPNELTVISGCMSDDLFVHFKPHFVCVQFI